MKLRTITARAAVAGATTALIAGGLVAATGTAANAVEKTAAYTCTNPLIPAPGLPVSVTGSGDIPVSSLPTGTVISGLAIPLGLNFTVPQAAASQLHTYGVNNVSASSTDFGLALGSSNIPVSGVATSAPVAVGDGDLVLPVTTANITQVSTPAPGDYSIALPQAFSMVVTTDSGIVGTLTVACTLNQGEDPAITPFSVTKQGATVAGKAPAKVKQKKAFKIVTTVTGQNIPATGKVVAKDGTKTVGTGVIKNGKTTINVAKGLKYNKKTPVHTINLIYAGDDNTAASQGGVLISVKK